MKSEDKIYEASLKITHAIDIMLRRESDRKYLKKLLSELLKEIVNSLEVK